MQLIACTHIKARFEKEGKKYVCVEESIINHVSFPSQSNFTRHLI